MPNDIAIPTDSLNDNAENLVTYLFSGQWIGAPNKVMTSLRK